MRTKKAPAIHCERKFCIECIKMHQKKAKALQAALQTRKCTESKPKLLQLKTASTSMKTCKMLTGLFLNEIHELDGVHRYLRDRLIPTVGELVAGAEYDVSEEKNKKKKNDTKADPPFSKTFDKLLESIDKLLFLLSMNRKPILPDERFNINLVAYYWIIVAQSILARDEKSIADKLLLLSCNIDDADLEAYEDSD